MIILLARGRSNIFLDGECLEAENTSMDPLRNPPSLHINITKTTCVFNENDPPTHTLLFHQECVTYVEKPSDHQPSDGTEWAEASLKGIPPLTTWPGEELKKRMAHWCSGVVYKSTSSMPQTPTHTAYGRSALTSALGVLICDLPLHLLCDCCKWSVLLCPAGTAVIVCSCTLKQQAKLYMCVCDLTSPQMIFIRCLYCLLQEIHF